MADQSCVAQLLLLLLFVVVIVTQVRGQDLAEEVVRAHGLVLGATEGAEVLQSNIEEFYYTFLEQEVEPLTKEIEDNLLAIGIPESSVNRLQTKYTNQKVSTKVMVDTQLENMDVVLLELSHMISDLLENLLGLEKDMVVLSDVQGEMQVTFKFANSNLKTRMDYLKDSTIVQIEGLEGDNVEAIKRVLAELTLKLEDYHQATGALNYQFLSFYSSIRPAIHRILDLMPPDHST